MLKIDFPPEFLIRQMYSFPIMYDGLAVRDHFFPKNGWKAAILADTILDRLTSEGDGTPILTILGTFDIYVSIKIWSIILHMNHWETRRAPKNSKVQITSLMFG